MNPFRNSRSLNQEWERVLVEKSALRPKPEGGAGEKGREMGCEQEETAPGTHCVISPLGEGQSLLAPPSSLDSRVRIGPTSMKGGQAGAVPTRDSSCSGAFSSRAALAG